MPVPLKIQEIGCRVLSFSCRIEKKNFDLAAFTKTLSEALPKAKGIKRLPIFLPIDPINPETDCHLHFSLAKREKGNTLNLGLELMPVKESSRAPSEVVSIERIQGWLGRFISQKTSGIAYAIFQYDAPPYESVISLPRSGIVPIESALIRKSSVSGIEVTVEESDIGLRRVFISKSTSNKIELIAMFRFTHKVDYALFGQLADRAKKISALFVLKEKQR